MDESREGGLLAWQFSNYPTGHRNRQNLAVHVATAPIFMAGTAALLLAPFNGPSLLMFAVPAVLLPLVLQGRGHRMEANRPLPFRGLGDLVARFFVEQWVTFPRYVLSGGFSSAWHAAGVSPDHEHPRSA
jgi:hypothetical protein